MIFGFCNQVLMMILFSFFWYLLSLYPGLNLVDQVISILFAEVSWFIDFSLEFIVVSGTYLLLTLILLILLYFPLYS